MAVPWWSPAPGMGGISSRSRRARSHGTVGWLHACVKMNAIVCGRRLAPAEARAAGLVDEVVPLDDLEGRALDVAEKLGTIPGDTFALTKRQLRQPLLDRLVAAENIDAEVLAIWQSDRALAGIRDYMERTVRRR